MKKIKISLAIPDLIYKILKQVRNKFLDKINLEGDRQIEWSFILANLPQGPGKVLDFGPGQESHLGLAAVEKGFEVIAVDLEEINWVYTHPNLKFICKDFLKIKFPKNHFDLIINCSSVEHVGLPGRYGIKIYDRNGDLKAMKKMKNILKPSGRMLLTIPTGKDSIFIPWHRVYGKKRLPKLLDGFKIEKEEYWGKNEENQWMPITKEKALSSNPSRNFYNLGCFVLKK